MPISQQRLRWLVRLSLTLLNVVVALLVVATGVLVYLESKWVTPQFAEPAAAFWQGTIGTELMPLPVALVLPSLAPHHFQPDGSAAGDWIEQFGFLRRPDNPDGLPIGFSVSNYRPQSAAPSPVPFVGFSCALCHTTAIRRADKDIPKIVTGPGSVSLNLFAWVDAFQAALIERQPLANGEVFNPKDPPPYLLTVDRIVEAYARETGAELGVLARLMINLWLSQVRDRMEAGLSRFDEPYGHGRSRGEKVTPTGPTRTQPFRTLIRSVLNRPGNDMAVYTKIATIFSQDLRPRAQFDGSLTDLDARSSLAALAAGATVINMAKPEIAHNIQKASAYTTTLRSPSYADMFPDRANIADVARARGRQIYREHCFGCHGGRTDDGSWTTGPCTNTVIPLPEIGTDPERVAFRHYGELPGRTHALFSAEHPLRFDREDIFPMPGQEDDLTGRGYVAAAIDGVFLRAPYLHNASVLTLAELINLKPRRRTFFRGHNLYDPDWVGFVSPAAADARRYFPFDSSKPGNANTGHDYPWAYDDPTRSEADLLALLEYLKTL
jgi:hypothetical protein